VSLLSCVNSYFPPSNSHAKEAEGNVRYEEKKEDRKTHPLQFSHQTCVTLNVNSWFSFGKSPNVTFGFAQGSIVRWLIDCKFVGGGLVVAGCVEALGRGCWSIGDVEDPTVKVICLEKKKQSEDVNMGVLRKEREGTYNPPVP
jgi:hypothetical protein